MSKLKDVEKGKRVCDELLDEIDDLEEKKIKLVVKLLKKVNIHREYGETFYEFNLRIQKEILQFIRSWEEKIKK